MKTEKKWVASLFSSVFLIQNFYGGIDATGQKFFFISPQEGEELDEHSDCFNDMIAEFGGCSYPPNP